MLSFSPVTLEDRSTLQPFLRQHHFENSELTFTSLYLWRTDSNIEYCVTCNTLFIKCRFADQNYYFSPIVGQGARYGDAVALLHQDAKQRGYPLNIRGLPAQIVEQIQAECGNAYEIVEDRNNFDYVYLQRDLAELKGKKFHAKRNHVNKFNSLYTYEYHAYEPRWAEGCKEAAHRWTLGKMVGETIEKRLRLQIEYDMVCDALDHYQELELIGGVIVVDGVVEAFALGEVISPQMAIVQIEKANTDREGSYAVINQQFAKHALGNVTYVNREEDMGLPGLRRAKESYNPVRMVVKYDLKPRTCARQIVS